MLLLAGIARVAAAWPAIPHAHAGIDSARADLARSLALIESGSPAAAHEFAARAVAEDPTHAASLAILARTELAMGDAIAAEATLDRAVRAGYDAAKLRQLSAHAALLKGNADAALAALDTADPRYARYSDRIRAQALAAKGDIAGAYAAFDAALDRYPADGEIRAAYVRFVRSTGDQAAAIAASEQAVAVAPRSASALALRAELVRAQYGLIAALPWFERALQRDPHHHDTLIDYAATLGDAGQTEKMLAAVRRAAAVRPGSAMAYYLQAVLAARAGAFDTARLIVQRIGGRLDNLPAMALLAGALDLEAGGYQQAIERLSVLVERQPMNIQARMMLASAYARADASRDAIVVLAPVVARPDASAYALTLLARAHERIGEREAAARLLDRAAIPSSGAADAFGTDAPLSMLTADAARDAGTPLVEIPLIRGLEEAGDRAGAYARAQALVRAFPGVPDAHLLAGDLLMLDGQAGMAARSYSRAANLRFDEPIMLRLVEAQERSGDRPAAARTLALFLSQNPVNLAALRMTAHWQLAAGDYDAAIDSLEAVRLRSGNRDAVLLGELAAAYTGAGDPARGLVLAQAGYALAPANPVVADAHGWALRETGDGAGAVQLLAKAVRLAPGHAMLHWHLAQAYADIGARPRAVAEARLALANPGFPERAAAQALIARFA